VDVLKVTEELLMDATPWITSAKAFGTGILSAAMK
jgi:hypothetical protein